MRACALNSVLLSATLALGLLVPSTAQATTFQSLSLVQQARKADVIVQATIGTPTTVTEGAQTYVVYPLKVSETLAGDAASLPQTVGSQNGNGPALYVLSGVDSAPVFQSGQEAVLLLYKGRLDSPLVGYNQGAYLISGGLVSPLNAPLAPGTAVGTPGTGGPASTVQGAAGQGGSGQGGSGQGGPGPSQVGSPRPPPASANPAGTTLPGTSPSTPVASSTPGTASDASAGASNGAAINAAVNNPATAVQGISAANPGSVAGTVVPPTAPLPAASAGGTGVPGSTVASGTTTTPQTTMSQTTGTGSTPAAAPGATSTGSTPGSTTVPSAATPAGVLGSIRTPAELKAAIVAARAAK